MALTNLSSGRQEEISSLQLLCFLPDTYEAEAASGLFGRVQWIEGPATTWISQNSSDKLWRSSTIRKLLRRQPDAPGPSCRAVPCLGLRAGPVAIDQVRCGVWGPEPVTTMLAHLGTELHD
jgi:hypothetical protein